MAVTLDGTVRSIGSLEQMGGKKVTRHHIIDIKTLQDFWNRICERDDWRLIGALASWAGAPTRLVQQMNLPNAAKPNKVIQQICWNPFNIVVGPNAAVRPANPGEREFDYIAFIDDLGVTKLEFNTHVKRLRSIEQYMKLYLVPDSGSQVPANTVVSPLPGLPAKDIGAHAAARNTASQEATVTSLVALLNADRPSHYPKLFAMLRSLESPRKAEMNQQTDSVRPPNASAYSPDYIPGALLHPAFWDNTFSSKAQLSGPASF